jgi:hypothetical protein
MLVGHFAFSYFFRFSMNASELLILFLKNVWTPILKYRTKTLCQSGFLMAHLPHSGCIMHYRKGHVQYLGRRNCACGLTFSSINYVFLTEPPIPLTTGLLIWVVFGQKWNIRNNLHTFQLITGSVTFALVISTLTSWWMQCSDVMQCLTGMCGGHFWCFVSSTNQKCRNIAGGNDEI